MRAMQLAVLRAIALRQPLEEVALLVCRQVERLAPGVVCSVLRVEDGRLYPVAGPNLPDGLSAAIEGMEIGPEVGSCGRAAFLGESVETLDIAADPNWAPAKEFPLAAGLRACWSTPIMGHEGAAVGSFAFYYRTCRGPTALERRVVAACVDLCATAIEQAAMWSRLRRTNQRIDVVLSNLSQGVCLFDGEQRLIVANRRYSEIYGLSPADVTPGTTLQDIVAMRRLAGSGPVMEVAAYMFWRQGVQVEDAPNDSVVELENGRTISIHHQPMPDSGWVATHEDITDRRRAEAQIVHMARHDALTGLPNRLLFRERMEQTLARTRMPAGTQAGAGIGCAVLCVDIDRFKIVNDTLGHPAGDLLLLRAAARLSACVRPGDTVTRLGGDEFAVLLAGVERADEAREAGRKIVEAMGDPFDLEGHSVTVGASVGIAVAPQDGTAAATLLKRADMAMYRAKLERGMVCCFEPEMEVRLQERLQLEQDLRQAVRDEVFELAYQPLVNLTSSEICCFEALLRWRHPDRGAIAPSEFIPLAEETGLILPLGAWVIRHACAQAARWPPAIKVAVNLSAVQFRGDTLVGTVRDALAAAGLDPARLELEITETVLLQQTEDVLSTLHELRKIGVRISLDDFGTGYSSLRYLRSFPFDKIKIDQSFVRDLSDKADAIAVIRAIVGLGRSLGMVTTAEGVETEDQLEQVWREGCTEVQGFLFSRPVGAEAAGTMARARWICQGSDGARHRVDARDLERDL